LTSSGYQRVT